MDEPMSQPAGPLTAAGIPRSLGPCFHEYDLERLDPAQHGDLLIVGSIGNWNSLRLSLASKLASMQQQAIHRMLVSRQTGPNVRSLGRPTAGISLLGS